MVNKRLILIIGILSLIFISGCDKNGVYGCDVKGHIVKDVDLCKAIVERENERYELGKSIGKECSEEIVKDIYNGAYERCFVDIKNNIYSNCLLVITDGSKPEIPDYYDYTKEDFFPMRILDFKTDTIKSSEDGSWNYWVVCKR